MVSRRVCLTGRDRLQSRLARCGSVSIPIMEQPMGPLLIKAGRVYDGVAERPLEHAYVVDAIAARVRNIRKGRCLCSDH